MKIDSHQHFWKYNASEHGWISDDMCDLRRDFLPVDLEKELCTVGLDGSIAVQVRQSLEESGWLLHLADKNSFIKGVVGWVDLCSPDVEQQLSLFSKNKKFVGVRHIVQDEPDNNFLLRSDFIRGIECLQRFNLTYDILIYPKHIRAAVRLAAQFPNMRFVLNHLAKPLIKSKIISPWKEDIKELSQCPNVFCKVSGMVTEADWNRWKQDDFVPYLDVVFEKFQTERLMIGSDWPVCTLAGTYQRVMSIVCNYIKSFPTEEQAAILGGNAMRAYNLTAE